MARSISQRELRNESGDIMRALDRGETFVVTRNGVPVGELRPIARSRYVDAGVALAAFRGAPAVDAARFRRDVDSMIDQRTSPRA
ncbi:MAG TPA: hypothetical protein VGO03_01170 [Acidimicrobiia bacterium]|jgi:antitoxin (DNA-binding transcriptional repressor) of toxin-antitoxin stability system